MLPAAPGTYLLQLECSVTADLCVGRLGHLQLQPGCYLYLGSARGPGGLAARLRHHLKPAPKPHWHLDYLRRATTVKAIWYSTSACADECLWAEALAGLRGCRPPLPGFGASDCNCPAHLFWRPEAPRLASFRRRLRVFCPEPGLFRRVALSDLREEL